MGCRLERRPKQRRARRSGMSPYQRHSKAPYQYSARHREWQRSMGRKVQSENGAAH